jgi:hypothetical protein
MEDILKVIEEDGFFKNLEASNTETDATEAVQKAFEGKSIKETLTVEIDNTGKKFIVRKSGSGSTEVKTDIKDLQKYLNGDADSKINIEPDIGKALNAFIDVDFNSPDFKKLDTEYRAQFRESTGVSDITTLQNTLKQDALLTKIFASDPQTINEFNDMLSENKDPNAIKIKKLVDDLQKSCKENPKEEVGRWKKIKDAATIAALAAGGIAFYTAIKDHQNEMNGCWLVNIKSGQKCKVQPLTCDSGARNAVSDAPCLICGNWSQSSCFNTCNGTQCNKTIDGICTPPPGNCCNTTPSTTPPTSPTKIDCLHNDPSTIQGNCDSDGMCSNLCNSSSYNNIQSGYSLVCSNVSWWGAAIDLIGDIPGDITSMLQKILKWGLMIGGIIILAIFLVFIAKFFLGKLTEKK